MNKPDNKTAFLQRKRAASGVHISRNVPTIVFVTVCTRNRVAWLAQPAAHAALLAAWAEADGWLIGFYMIMPDHIHFFCAPSDLEMPFKNWMRYWKSRFRKMTPGEEWRWQSGEWDTRLRRSDNYHQKWEYVRSNPVLKKLVDDPDKWPFQGELNVLRW